MEIAQLKAQLCSAEGEVTALRMSQAVGSVYPVTAAAGRMSGHVLEESLMDTDVQDKYYSVYIILRIMCFCFCIICIHIHIHIYIHIYYT